MENQFVNEFMVFIMVYMMRIECMWIKLDGLSVRRQMVVVQWKFNYTRIVFMEETRQRDVQAKVLLEWTWYEMSCVSAIFFGIYYPYITLHTWKMLTQEFVYILFKSMDIAVSPICATHLKEASQSTPYKLGRMTRILWTSEVKQRVRWIAPSSTDWYETAITRTIAIVVRSFGINNAFVGINDPKRSQPLLQKPHTSMHRTWTNLKQAGTCDTSNEDLPLSTYIYTSQSNPFSYQKPNTQKDNRIRKSQTLRNSCDKFTERHTQSRI